jgi:outer membrane protein assembly factor BamB
MQRCSVISKFTSHFLLFTSYFLLSLHATPTAQWPQFRGPEGQGHSGERGLPLEWSETRNVVWKTPIGGRGWSSPVVSNGRVWVTTAVAERGGASLRAIAIEEESGRELLNVEVFRLSNANLKNEKNSHASPTPILDGDRIYVHFGGDGTAALDATSGKILWTKKFPYASQHGSGGSPVLYKDRLIFSGDGHLEAWVIALGRSSRMVLCSSRPASSSPR